MSWITPGGVAANVLLEAYDGYQNAKLRARYRKEAGFVTGTFPKRKKKMTGFHESKRRRTGSGFVAKYGSASRFKQPKRYKHKKPPRTATGAARAKIRSGQSGGGDATALVIRKGKRQISNPKQKTKKVSKKFVKKVTKAVEQGKQTPKGTFTYSVWGYQVTTGVTNGQTITDIGTLSSTTAFPASAPVCPTSLCFSVEMMIHAVSVLWNNKDNVLDLTPAITAINTPGSFGEHLPELEFDVVSCSEEYTIKNVSDRVVKGIIYLCAPKKAGVMNYGYTRSNTTTQSPGSTDFENNALKFTHVQSVPGTSSEKWTISALNDNNDALMPPAVAWTSSDVLASHGSLQSVIAGNADSSTDPINMGSVPTDTPYFARKWKSEKTFFCLNPGQTFSYKVNGPKNEKMDCKKWFRSETSADPLTKPSTMILNNIQKFVRAPILVTWPDTALGLTNDNPVRHYVGHLGDTIPNLSIDRVSKFKFTCPDLVAGQLLTDATFGDLTYNGNIKDRYFKSFTPSGGVPSLDSIEDRVPVAFGTGTD